MTTIEARPAAGSKAAQPGCGSRPAHPSQVDRSPQQSRASQAASRARAARGSKASAAPRIRPVTVTLLVRSGPVPLVACGIVAILMAPFLLFDTRLVPTAAVVLVASLGYLLGARRLARREPGSWFYLWLASAMGIIGLTGCSAVCASIAERQDAHEMLLPCAGSAFAIPALVFLLGVAFSATRPVRTWSSSP